MARRSSNDRSDLAQEIGKAVATALDASAANFAKQIAEAIRGATGSASAGPAAPGGATLPAATAGNVSSTPGSGGLVGKDLGTRAGAGVESFGVPAPLSAVGGVLASAGNYAAARTPYGTTGTTDQLGQNLEMGILRGIADLAKPVPVLGAFVDNQVKGLEEAVYEPERRVNNRLGAVFGQMARAGIDVSDAEIRQASQYGLQIERRGVYMEQRVRRITAAANADNGSAISGALSQIGL